MKETRTRQDAGAGEGALHGFREQPHEACDVLATGARHAAAAAELDAQVKFSLGVERRHHHVDLHVARTGLRGFCSLSGDDEAALKS